MNWFRSKIDKFEAIVLPGLYNKKLEKMGEEIDKTTKEDSARIIATYGEHYADERFGNASKKNDKSKNTNESSNDDVITLTDKFDKMTSEKTEETTDNQSEKKGKYSSFEDMMKESLARKEEAYAYETKHYGERREPSYLQKMTDNLLPPNGKENRGQRLKREIDNEDETRDLDREYHHQRIGNLTDAELQRKRKELKIYTENYYKNKKNNNNDDVVYTNYLKEHQNRLNQIKTYSTTQPEIAAQLAELDKMKTAEIKKYLADKKNDILNKEYITEYNISIANDKILKNRGQQVEPFYGIDDLGIIDDYILENDRTDIDDFELGV